MNIYHPILNMLPKHDQDAGDCLLLGFGSLICPLNNCNSYCLGDCLISMFY